MLRIFVDGSEAWISEAHSCCGGNQNGISFESGADICGYLGYSHYFEDVEITVGHTGEVLEIMMTGPNQGCTDESFGFSAFSLVLGGVEGQIDDDALGSAEEDWGWRSSWNCMGVGKCFRVFNGHIAFSEAERACKDFGASLGA